MIQSLNRLPLWVSILIIVFLSACDPKKELLDTEHSQVHTRSYQTRTYDETDQKKVLQASISTLQDLGFAITHGDYNLGLISAEKPGNYVVKMTVTARKKDDASSIVRAVAQYDRAEISDPEYYQIFFTKLHKSLFLK